MSEIIQTKRCAIYTRKSSEDGLEQEFNSLDAQREAGEAYILSQKHRGWTCLDTNYADGGYSGGNIERPALKRLTEDIEAGKVDVVIVYKIDRLSRSLLDFASLLTLFDKHNVSFVSVTQDINTSSSAGRMMLNILMTFAQYEREIIGERIRDKVAAAKKKGKHCGGPPPMGYMSEPKTKKLIPVESEAQVVKRIFERYRQLGSARDVAGELQKEGIVTPEKISRKGNTRGGVEFTPALIYTILSNPTYVGKVKHFDQIHDGEHEPIIGRKLYDEVQSVLAMNTVHDGKLRRRLSPMRGLIYCGHCGSVMGENFTKKSNRCYRYYVCEADAKRLERCCPVKAVPVAELDKLILDEISGMLQSPTMVAGILHDAAILSVNGKSLKLEVVLEALKNMGKVWEVMFPAERHKFIHAIIAKVTVNADTVKIQYNVKGLEQVLTEAGVTNEED